MNKVLLLIPYYNNSEGLIKSLVSIDPDEELDVIVIDDGSKNKFDEVILKNSFKAKGTLYFEYLKQPVD